MIRARKKKILSYIALVMVLTLGYLIVKKTSVKKYDSGNLKVEKVALKSLVEKDSNNNSIADWEEALWGLNPYANGDANKTFIEEKKKEGEVGNSTQQSTPQETKNETEIFAEDLLSSIASLKTDGSLSADNLSLLSDKISSSVKENVALLDKYSLADINIKSDTSKTSISKYFSDFKATLKKHDGQGIGEELKVVAAAVNTDNGAGINDLKSISESYFSLAEDLKKIGVPASAGLIHVNLINDLVNVGVAVRNISELYTNSIVGTIGLSQHDKYSTELINDFVSLNSFFTQNGIIAQVQ